jgi:hypothetical protein
MKMLAMLHPPIQNPKRLRKEYLRQFLPIKTHSELYPIVAPKTKSTIPYATLSKTFGMGNGGSLGLGLLV